MDGAVGITQNPIKAGDSFTYNFHIEDTQAGTFWYHSHSGNQRADGLYGGIVIHGPLNHAESISEALQYEGESLLLIGDWYHRPAAEVEASYVTHDSWGREPVPDSLLVNGMGAFDCSMAVQARPLHCIQLSQSPLVLKKERTRIRIVNVGAISGLVISMPHCFMQVFESDGGNVIQMSPRSSSVGTLYPGERMDFVVECSVGDDAVESHLSVTLDAENFAIQNQALTLTHYFPVLTSSKIFTKRGHPYAPPETLKGKKCFDLATVKGPTLSEDFFPGVADQNILLYTKMEVLARLGNVPAGFINRTTWVAQNSPSKPLIEIPRGDWDGNQLVPWIPVSRDDSKTTWSISLSTTSTKKVTLFTWYHGYDFYVITQYYPETRGYHAYNPFNPSTPPTSLNLPGGPYNLVNPPKKDTIYVPSQGYVVLRLRADNIGIWFFHCHILWHSGTGMAMSLQVGYDDEAS
ncbi:Laccase-1 [Lachnellula suecica]|uniref:Laccase-1 n=1 Tax=Lachnellula suecica TaxID=602035 RepID=A0A8T9CG04_9HELO|nr:Laccase-1 [Lachnellula suecica]